MHYALQPFFSCYESVEILLKAGADVNNRTDNGETALLAAVNMDLDNNYETCHSYEKSRHGCVKVVNMLIEAGADVNAKDKKGQTVLFFVAWWDYYPFSLTVAGVGVNDIDKGDCSGLHYLNCIRRLLRAGIRINKKNQSFGKNTLTSILLLRSQDISLYPNRAEELESNDAVIKILYAAGETLDFTEEDEKQEELKFEDEKLELKHICREAIRKHLLKLDPYQHLFSRVPRLGLPSMMTEYLLFNQSLDDDNDDDDDDDYTQKLK